MTSRSGSALNALFAATLIGVEVFAVLVALDWAVLSHFPHIPNPVLISAAITVPFAVTAMWYMACLAYRAERTLDI